VQAHTQAFVRFAHHVVPLVIHEEDIAALERLSWAPCADMLVRRDWGGVGGRDRWR
jgi:hypothetical protein